MKYQHNRNQTNWPTLILGWVILTILSVLVGLFLGLKYIESQLEPVYVQTSFMERVGASKDIPFEVGGITEDYDIQPAAGYKAMNWRLR